MTEAVVSIENLSKTYHAGWSRRSVIAVHNLNLLLEPGSVVALVGPNGAGKTTTIYAMLGLLKPDRGSVSIFGLSASDPASRIRVGYQSEIFYSYPFLIARKALCFYGGLSGLSRTSLPDESEKMLVKVGLGTAMDRQIGTFSKGMVQRLGLAQAMLHKPDLLILDEPTTGLDPEGRRMVAKLIKEEKERGATVFLSSHILSDVERTCDRVVMIRAGEVVYTGDLRDPRDMAQETGGWEIHVDGLTADKRMELETWGCVCTVMESATGCSALNGNRCSINCSDVQKQEILQSLIALPCEIVLLHRRGTSLEDLYMKHLGGAGE